MPKKIVKDFDNIKDWIGKIVSEYYPKDKEDILIYKIIEIKDRNCITGLIYKESYKYINPYRRSYMTLPDKEYRSRHSITVKVWKKEELFSELL